jgi:glutathione S-transferase
MARFKLIYFKGRARAELARLIFHAAGEEFEDVQLDDHSWQQIKTTSPTGSLPMLVNNETNEQLVQSMSIARYLAQEFGLAGNGRYEMALVDSVADTLNDLLGDVVEVTFEDDSKRKKERIRRFHERALPETLEYLERFIERHGKGSGYSVGDGLTYADLCIYNTIDQMVLAGVAGWKDFEKHPHLHKIVRNIDDTPRLAGYVKTRPPAAF